MNTPLKLAKTMNKCARVLRQRSSQLVSPRSGTWPAMVKPKSSVSFKPSTTTNLSANPSQVLAARDPSVSVDQKRFYNDRNNSGESNQRERYQSGMDATYDMPNMDDAQPRYDQIYLNKEQAPTFEGNVEHEGFDPRYNEYHFKRQAHEPERYPDLRERRSTNARKAYNYVFGDKFPYSELTQQDTESRRRMTQGPLEHQLRQERIIEENKRKWQNRAEPKREVYAHGMTYKTDKVYGADKGTPRPSRAIRDRQAAEDYSRRRRTVRENELRRLAEELRQSRTGLKSPVGGSERSKTEMQKTDEDEEHAKPPSSSWANKQREEENEMYWHSWNTCPDERRVMEKGQQVTQDRGLGFGAQRPKPYHPYDVTRRSLHQHQYAKEDNETFNEYQYNLKAHTSVRPKQTGQLKRDYLLNLMQQDEEIRNVQDFGDDDENDDLELSPPTRRRVKPATTMCLPKSNEMADSEPSMPKENELTLRHPERRISNYRIPNKLKLNLPKNRSQSRSIEPPRFHMSIKSRVVRNRAPVSSFSETIIGKTPIPVTKPIQHRNFARPSVSSTWGDFTSAHFAKVSNF